jgi:uncharacterized protein (DUF983 family)
MNPLNSKCPRCAQPISFNTVSAKFTCRSCGAELESSATLAFVVVMIVGGFPTSVGAAFGGLGAVLGFALSIALSLGLWHMLVDVRTRAEARNEA